MTRWGLVGRDRELRLLRAALTDPATRGVLLTGAPGVGKTRLAAELLEHAARRGWATQWAIGSRGIAGVPFGAFAHLLPAGNGAVSSLEVMRRAGDELRRSSGDRPVVLAVDDAHLLDEESAELTHLLATTDQAFVVATACACEPLPGGIAVLRRATSVRTVGVRELTRHDVGHLLSTVLGGQLDTTTRHRLWDASRGNVLFLHELVLIGLERGLLTERDDVWCWVGELVSSDRLTELVEARLACLTPAQRSALEVLAVGEPLPQPVLACVVGEPLVQGLYRSGLVTVGRQAQRQVLRVAHPLYAEAVRAGLGAVRRRAIYRELADALAATGLRRRDDVLRASLWRLESGGPADPGLLVEGARRARAMFDHRQAERLARAALEESAGADARVTLADALHRQGRYAEARSLIAGGPPADAGAATVAEWATVAASILFWGLGDAAEAETVIRSAEQACPPGPDGDRLVAHRATLAFFHGRPADALAAAHPLTRGGRSPEIAVQACIASVPALAVLGRCGAALDLADYGLRVGVDLIGERPQLVGELRAMQVIACWLAGRYRQMEELATIAYQHVVVEKTHDLRGLWAMLLGRAALAAGRAATARRRLREACALFRQHDPNGLLPWALGCSALAAALLGAVEDAQRDLAEHRACQFPAVRIFEWEAVLAEAWTAAALGEHSRARNLACRAATVAADAGLRAPELAALHDALRLGDRQVAPRIVALAAEVDSALAAAFADHAAGLLGGDGDALDQAAARFAELGATLAAAEASAEAAEEHGRADRAGARRASLARFRWAASSCEGAQTPSLRRAGGPPALHLLTNREREVAEVAARGLSKREIADRLRLSVRTVGNHLNHIYTKTGISGRDELAALLGLAPAHRGGPGRRAGARRG